MLAVISDVKGEQYRFERLLQGLQDLGVHYVHRGTSNRYSMAEDHQDLILYDCVTSALHLFNAIVQTPDTIEKRDSIRIELERRGLEDYLRRLEMKRMVLPETLKNQMNLYMKQKASDQEKIRILESTKRQSILQL